MGCSSSSAAASPVALRAGVLAEELDALFVRVVLEMAVAKVLFLLRPRLGYPRLASYGGADAGDLGRVEVEEEGGEAGGGLGDGGAAGRAAGVGEWPMGDPCKCPCQLCVVK